jgi:hypothetical protein
MRAPKQPTAKQIFIGEYLDRAMKDHGLPYGMTYLDMVEVERNKAAKEWNRLKRAKREDMIEFAKYCFEERTFGYDLTPTYDWLYKNYEKNKLAFKSK